MNHSQLAHQLNEKFAFIELEERLGLIAEHAPDAVFTTSLGMEDQVLTWAIAKTGLPISIATLQTGRLFPETLSLLHSTREKYGVEITEFTPDNQQVMKYVQQFGRDGFYQSVEARKACCTIRKVIPLNAALAGADGWVTGIRRQSSNNRNSVDFVEWDAERGLLKFNPLADWSADQIKASVEANDIPINALHARGYPSIGCEPCTRAINPGESERAGRWWWEDDGNQECGLHVRGSKDQPQLAEKNLNPREGSDGVRHRP